MGIVSRPTVGEKKFWGIGYGDPGAGKTNWGTAYPEEWGEGIYLAMDNDAARLDSVLPKYRSRLHVKGFEDDDIISNMSEFAVADWQEEHPKAGVIIVDTFSRASKQMMKYAANQGFFKGAKGDAHIKFGPKDAEITQSLPSMSDYGGTQHLIMNWVDLLFQHQRHMHIILLCHEYFYIPGTDAPASASAFGGPDTVGKAGLKEFASEFPVVIRLVVKNKKGLDGVVRAKYQAIGSMQGDFTARIKEGLTGPNPMAIVELQRDPQHWYRSFIENGFMDYNTLTEVK